MRTIFRHLAAAAALAVGALPLSALAQLTTSVSISNVALSTTDLTPADALPAGVQWVGGGGYVLVAVRDHEQELTGNVNLFEIEPASVERTLPHAAAMMSTSGELGAITGQSSASSNIPGVSYANAQTYLNNSLLLAPYSALTVTGHVSMDALWNGPDPDVIYYQAIVLYGVDLYYIGSTDARGSLSLRSTDGTTSAHGEHDFTLEFANNTALDQQLYLSFGAAGEAMVVSVPEPSIFPMLASGLLILAAPAAIRRQQRRTC